MKNSSFLFLLCTIVLFACNNPQATSDKTSKVTQAWDKMMVIHDEVMPEMSTINKLKKSFKALPQDSTTLNQITDLTKAEKAMWDWMHNLTPQDQVNKMSETEAMAYLQEATKEISIVKNMMLERIEKGKKMLDEMKVSDN